MLRRSVSDKEIVSMQGCLRSKGREALRGGPFFTREHGGCVSLGRNLSMICELMLNKDIGSTGN